MGRFVSVLKAEELPPGGMRLVDVGGAEVVVANVDGTYCAFSNLCPHEQGPLAEGEIEGEIVTCPWHFSRFNVRTGEVVDGLTDDPVATFLVREAGGLIEVEDPNG
jgi:3-phenylpropionate/trans-cinnamate dioxygenase ferredoxin component